MLNYQRVNIHPNIHFVDDSHLKIVVVMGVVTWL